MKRRRFIAAIASVPAAAVVVTRRERVVARQGSGQAGTSPATRRTTVPVPEASWYEAVAGPVPRFFTAEQFATLKKLAEVLVPAQGGAPGAIEAGAPEFLDFYVGVSSADLQRLYRDGLDDVDAQARTRHRQSFAALDAAQIDSILRPMFRPYPGRRSATAFGPFVNEVRTDLQTAATNSREFAAAAEASGRRAPAGLYWRRIDPTILLR